jgi:hypothetical protein
MKIKSRFLKQVDTGAWWGGFKSLVSSAGGYASWTSLALQVFNFYLLSSGWFNERNISIPLWLFGISVFLFAIGVFIFEWKVTLPSSYKFTNRQAYEHGNPIREDLNKVINKLNHIQKELDEIKKHTGKTIQ